MSKVTKDSVEEKRPTYVVDGNEVDSFDADGKIKFITSMELCKFVNDYFRFCFVDYVGCKFELVQGSVPVFSLFFSHVENQDDDLHYGCERPGNLDPKKRKSIIDMYDAINARYKDGDRYIVSQDGQDIIVPLLNPGMFNNGKPNWHRIAGDFVENASGYPYAGRGTVYTKVTGIDPTKICKLKWGAKDPESGNVYHYGVNVIASNNGMNPMLNSGNYNLQIVQADLNQIQETYRKLGLGNVGSQIITD